MKFFKEIYEINREVLGESVWNDPLVLTGFIEHKNMITSQNKMSIYFYRAVQGREGGLRNI